MKRNEDVKWWIALVDGDPMGAFCGRHGEGDASDHCKDVRRERGVPPERCEVRPMTAKDLASDGKVFVMEECSGGSKWRPYWGVGGVMNYESAKQELFTAIELFEKNPKNVRVRRYDEDIERCIETKEEAKRARRK